MLTIFEGDTTNITANVPESFIGGEATLLIKLNEQWAILRTIDITQCDIHFRLEQADTVTRIGYFEYEIRVSKDDEYRVVVHEHLRILDSLIVNTDIAAAPPIAIISGGGGSVDLSAINSAVSTNTTSIEMNATRIATNTAAIETNAAGIAGREPKLPDAPVSPDTHYLNGNRQWAPIPASGGGGVLPFTKRALKGQRTLSAGINTPIPFPDDDALLLKTGEDSWWSQAGNLIPPAGTYIIGACFCFKNVSVGKKAIVYVAPDNDTDRTILLSRDVGGGNTLSINGLTVVTTDGSITYDFYVYQAGSPALLHQVGHQEYNFAWAVKIA